MGALGWLGLTIPSAHGGVGASAVDAGALYSELGRGPFAGPLFESAVLAPAIMLAADPAGAVFSGRPLAAIADGEIDRGARCCRPPRLRPTAIDHVELELSGDRVRGRAGPVRHADRASAYLVLARTASPDAAIACALVDAFGSVGRGPGAPRLRSRAVRGRVSRRSRRRHVRSRSETPGWPAVADAVVRRPPGAVRLSSRQLSGRARHDRGLQRRSGGVRQAHRHVSAGAGPRHRDRQRPGLGPLDHLSRPLALPTPATAPWPPATWPRR